MKNYFYHALRGITLANKSNKEESFRLLQNQYFPKNDPAKKKRPPAFMFLWSQVKRLVLDKDYKVLIGEVVEENEVEVPG